MARDQAKKESALYGRDWRDVVASCWDAAKQAKHMDRTKLLIAEGWTLGAAEYLAYEQITQEAEP